MAEADSASPDCDTAEARDARRTTLTLLAKRAAGATVCPSEVARALPAPKSARADWRSLMPIVHAAIDGLVKERLVQLRWKGKDLRVRCGPYRIGDPSRNLMAFCSAHRPKPAGASVTCFLLQQSHAGSNLGRASCLS